MNIFKVLASGEARLKEPNVSAFLAFLLHPTESHGLGSKFLERFLFPLVQHNRDNNLSIKRGDNLRVKDLSRRSSHIISMDLEDIVTSPQRKKIDIVLRVSRTNDETSKLIHVLSIENKISKQAIAPDQLIPELDGIINKYPDPDVQYSFVFLTPDANDLAQKEFGILQSTIKSRSKDGHRIFTSHMIWKKSPDHKRTSMVQLLEDTIREESMGGIDPIDFNTLYILKSFMNFVQTDFRTYIEESSREPSDYICAVKQKLSGRMHPDKWKEGGIGGCARYFQLEIGKILCESFELYITRNGKMTLGCQSNPDGNKEKERNRNNVFPELRRAFGENKQWPVTFPAGIKGQQYSKNDLLVINLRDSEKAVEFVVWVDGILTGWINNRK